MNLDYDLLFIYLTLWFSNHGWVDTLANFQVGKGQREILIQRIASQIYEYSVSWIIYLFYDPFIGLLFLILHFVKSSLNFNLPKMKQCPLEFM